MNIDELPSPLGERVRVRGGKKKLLAIAIGQTLSSLNPTVGARRAVPSNQLSSLRDCSGEFGAGRAWLWIPTSLPSPRRPF